MKLRFAVALLLPLTASAADCDRECLGGFITQYLNAMVAHKPGALAVSDKVRFTEDTVTMKLGEGLWKNASGIRTHRQDILDVRQGVAASQVIVEESGSPVMLVLRLKVADKKITEVETQVTRSRDEGAIFNIDAIQAVSKAMNLVPERAQINSRADAIKIAEFYPAGLKIGSFVDGGCSVRVRCLSDRKRDDHGRTRLRARGLREHQDANHHEAPRDYESRWLAVDEELGIVLLRMNFGDTGSYGPGNALVVWEAFKVYGGQIHAVEAFMRKMPATAGSGWD